MNHYFTDNRQLEQNRKDFSFRFSCFTYFFVSDNGVFAKDGIDFGSRFLMETIEKDGLSGSVLDVGCGYGTIGTVLGKLFPEVSFDMIDVNPRAIELAKINAEKNDVKANVFLSNGFENVSSKQYNSIITNPPIRAGKELIYHFFSESHNHLQFGGDLWVVIRRQHGGDSAKKYIEGIFGNCEIISKKKGFYVLKATKNIDK